MSATKFSHIEACVFDAYGTLFDTGSAVAHMREELGEKAVALSSLWRSKQLEYTWLRSLMGNHADFWQVTGDALDYAMEAHRLKSKALRKRLMESYLTLDAYADGRTALERLKAAGLRCAILSNGSPTMLEAVVKNARLGSLLDKVLSVEEVGIYKPHPRVYRLAVDRLGISPERVSFQSANPWDAVGAKAFGFRVAWINRFGLKPERLPAKPDAEIKSLAELPGLLGLQRAAR